MNKWRYYAKRFPSSHVATKSMRKRRLSVAMTVVNTNIA
jgi:hypothetical protein